MMSWRHEWRRARAIARKDLTAERRSKAGFNSVVALAVTMLVMFGFALGPDAKAIRDAAPGTIWLTMLFAGVLAFNRSYQTELDGGALEQLVLYPGARRAIFAGKLLGNFAFVTLMLAIITVVGMVLFHVAVPSEWASFVAVLLLGVIGLVTLGTFYAAMASRSRAREVLLPLLLFPMLVPVLLAAMEATKALLGGDVMSDAGAWIRLLAAFDVIFLVATFLAFEFVIEV
jgi:heme exporter protein B